MPRARDHLYDGRSSTFPERGGYATFDTLRCIRDGSVGFSVKSEIRLPLRTNVCVKGRQSSDCQNEECPSVGRLMFLDCVSTRIERFLRTKLNSAFAGFAYRYVVYLGKYSNLSLITLLFYLRNKQPKT